MKLLFIKARILTPLLIVCAFTVQAAAQQSKAGTVSPQPEVQTAYLTNVTTTGGVSTISADYLQMLTGAAAVKAAKKAGDAEYELKGKDTTWYVPDDYYLVNDNPKIRTLPLSASATIRLLKGGSAESQKSTVAQLKKGYSHRLFYLTISGGVVMRVEEIYTP